MPYTMYKNDKGETCVRNSDTGESKGCSKSRKMGMAHMRAMYAHEGKKEIEIVTLVTKALDEFNALYPGEKDETEDLNTKDYGEMYPYSMYYGATSFEELDTIQENQDKSMDVNVLTNQYDALLQNIISSPMMNDKEKISSVDALGNEYKSRLESRLSGNDLKEKSFVKKALDAIKDMFSPKEQDENLMIYKEEGGGYSWIARYSNNFRDNDKPPEIISEASHKRFVDRVEKGLEPLPELWVWHIPEWKFGDATWVTYDDTGFAIAGGKIDSDKDAIAEELIKHKDILVSHGMPPSTIKRDAVDPSIIIEHATTEISVLPDWAAANKLTGFIVLDQNNKEVQEDDMPIPANKRKALIDKWGMNPSTLDALEKANLTDAQKAKTEGVQSKEAAVSTAKVSTDAVATAAVVTQAVETPVTAPATAADIAAAEVKAEQKDDGKKSETSQEYPTREEVADAFATIIAPFVDTTNTAIQALVARMDGFSGELKELKETDEAKITKQVSGTPAASLLAMFAARSAVGNPAAQVDGRSALAKSKPKEAQSDDSGATTGIPFIDSMLKPQ